MTYRTPGCALDAPLLDQPGKVLGRAKSAVGSWPLGIELEAILGAIDHRARGADLRLPDGSAGLDIDDDGMVEVDQIVGGIGKEGMALVGAGPLSGWIGPRHELRLHLAGRAPGRIVERVEILPDRAAAGTCRSTLKL